MAMNRKAEVDAAVPVIDAKNTYQVELDTTGKILVDFLPDLALATPRT